MRARRHASSSECVVVLPSAFPRYNCYFVINANVILKYITHPSDARVLCFILNFLHRAGHLRVEFLELFPLLHGLARPDGGLDGAVHEGLQREVLLHAVVAHAVVFVVVRADLLRARPRAHLRRGSSLTPGGCQISYMEDHTGLAVIN